MVRNEKQINKAAKEDDKEKKQDAKVEAEVEADRARLARTIFVGNVPPATRRAVVAKHFGAYTKNTEPFTANRRESDGTLATIVSRAAS